MPPKKDAKAVPKKKKDKGGPEDGGPLDLETQIKLLQYRCNSLEVQLAERTEDASKAHIEKRDIQRKLEQVTEDYEQEKKSCFEITQVMTRDYKGMQVELLDRIQKLEDTIIQLREKLANSDAIQERIIKEKDAEIQRKNDEILDLNTKMDDMAEEFSQMLKETLDKMKDRIEVTSGNFDINDMAINKRMDELSFNNRSNSRK